VKRQIAETDVAEVMVAWLQSMQWDVYQEVTLNGCVADIVATQGPLVWILECKTSFGIAVLGQAWEWRLLGRAHFVSIVVPSRRNHTGGRLEREMLDYTGIGMHCVRSPETACGLRYAVTHERNPSLMRRAPLVDDTRDKLREQHKTFAKAGNNHGDRWTPFADTCSQLAEFVRRNPGCTLKQGITSIKHHYSSYPAASGALRKWIDKGIAAGVSLRRDGKALTLHPATAPVPDAPFGVAL